MNIYNHRNKLLNLIAQTLAILETSYYSFDLRSALQNNLSSYFLPPKEEKIIDSVFTGTNKPTILINTRIIAHRMFSYSGMRFNITNNTFSHTTTKLQRTIYERSNSTRLQFIFITMFPFCSKVRMISLQHFLKHLIVLWNKEVIFSFEMLNNSIRHRCGNA